MEVKTQINRPRRFGKTLNMSMLEPRNHGEDDAIILEFKVMNKRRENSLEDTVQAAHTQIEEKQYKAQLTSHDIPAERIRCYGFAFEYKKVLIG